MEETAQILHLSHGKEAVILDPTDELVMKFCSRHNNQNEFETVQKNKQLVIELDVRPVSASIAANLSVLISCYDCDKNIIYWAHMMPKRNECLKAVRFTVHEESGDTIIEFDKPIPNLEQNGGVDAVRIVHFFEKLEDVEVIMSPIMIDLNNVHLQYFKAVPGNPQALKIKCQNPLWLRQLEEWVGKGEAVGYFERKESGSCGYLVPLNIQVDPSSGWTRHRCVVSGYGGKQYNNSKFRYWTKYFKIGVGLKCSSLAIANFSFRWEPIY